MAPASIVLALAMSAVGRPDGQTDVGRAPQLLFCCESDNDLYLVARSNGVHCQRFESPDDALRNARSGDGLLLLADGYPEERVDTRQRVLDQARRRSVRAFIEYPAALHGVELGDPKATQWERGVVTGNAFGPDAQPMTIVAPHGCRYLPTQADRPLLVVARVAGFDRAVYGLPPDAQPLLFEVPDQGLMVATTRLSGFVRGRFAPHEAWRGVLTGIVRWLVPAADVPLLDWEPTVGPAYGPDEPLPPGAERDAFARGARWYRRARILVDRTWLPIVGPAFSRSIEEAPALPPDLPLGDGSQGLLEGFSSSVQPDGSQPLRMVIRNDCLGESAFVFALEAALRDSRHSEAICRNLLDYICFDSLICQGLRADPRHPAYGLMAWGVTSYAWERAFYGDDNARALLGVLGAGAALGDSRWDRTALRALLANLRTTGTLGFRGNRIDIPDLEQLGWDAFHDRAIENPAPHYESYLWACFLWAYRATGHAEFLTKAEAGLRRTMELYPDGWQLTYGMTLDRSRLLLPLAWLVRVDDTPEHREWLRRIATDLLGEQAPCGAIREVLGDPERRAAPAVASNEAYGTAEVSIIQDNGDPASDQLYSVNFAFLALHEAAAATGDPALGEAENRLADYLCRIQVRSDARPELDGAWMRSFDFRRWEYWGSSGDVGWGAWCVESGWSQAWITAVFGLRLLGTSLWDLTANTSIATHLDATLAELERQPKGPYVPTPVTLRTRARGAAYTADPPADARYADPGGLLTDGEGYPPHAPHHWCGWEGPGPVTITVDLGEPRPLRAVGVRYMEDADLGIFPPTGVRVSASTDGEHFAPLGALEPDPLTPGDRAKTARIAEVEAARAARYIRVELEPAGTVPDWHAAAGRPAWLFLDEVVVR